jgi:Putative intracellular protease/amidase
MKKKTNQSINEDEKKIMFTIYVYVLDTLADWELGYVTSELNSGRFFKKRAPRVSLKTVSYSKEPIQTMGGMQVVPDCLIQDIAVSEESMLILPGADTWNDPKHGLIIEKASEFLSIGAAVCAICGATTALASFGLLNNRAHTSNGPGFLEMFCPNYKGQSFYIDKPSVADSNLITASSTGALLWAKQIIEHLGVFEASTLESWYDYFSTGEPKHFFTLMQSLPSRNEN